MHIIKTTINMLIVIFSLQNRVEYLSGDKQHKELGFRLNGGTLSYNTSTSGRNDRILNSNFTHLPSRPSPLSETPAEDWQVPPAPQVRTDVTWQSCQLRDFRSSFTSLRVKLASPDTPSSRLDRWRSINSIVETISIRIA